jgi:hypothetical protein
MSAELHMDADLKHILTPSISELSSRIQKYPNNSASKILLNIENEALEHIEALVLNLLHFTLTANFGQSNQVNYTNMHKVLDFGEIESRIQRILPKPLHDNASIKANHVLKTYQQLTKRTNLTLNRVLNLNKTQQLLVYRIKDFLDLFKLQYKYIKITLNTVVYLVAILEFITKDILRLSCGYVRNLNKFSITKHDVCIAIYADPMLTELLHTLNSTIVSDLSATGSALVLTPIGSVRYFVVCLCLSLKK